MAKKKTIIFVLLLLLCNISMVYSDNFSDDGLSFYEKQQLIDQQEEMHKINFIKGILNKELFPLGQDFMFTITHLICVLLILLLIWLVIYILN